MEASRVSVARGGVRATRAGVGPFEIQLLAFPAGHAIEPFDVERGYMVVVLEGAVAKTFVRSEWGLERHSLAMLPADAAHASRFGRVPTRVVAVRGRNGDPPELGFVVRRLRHVRATASTAVAGRLAAELGASDDSWPLAAEGLVLQLLAIAGRTERAPDVCRTRAVHAARDVLHERSPAPASLTELAAEVGLPAALLARSFRREFGVTVGEYARTLRLEWAASQLALSELSLARIAVEAGYADQSHFTRSFRAWAGVTPGRYRAVVGATPGAGSWPGPGCAPSSR
jgi:AraC family transcriptional regulator